MHLLIIILMLELHTFGIFFAFERVFRYDKQCMDPGDEWCIIKNLYMVKKFLGNIEPCNCGSMTLTHAFWCQMYRCKYPLPTQIKLCKSFISFRYILYRRYRTYNRHYWKNRNHHQPQRFSVATIRTQNFCKCQDNRLKDKCYCNSIILKIHL